MIYIALIYSFMFVLCLILLQFIPRYTVNSKVYRYGLVILVVMLCYIAYCYTPLRTDDLYRYYVIIDRIRERSIEWAIRSSSYQYEPFSNLLFIVVAKLTDNNAIYQTLAIILIYGIFILNIKKVTNFMIKKEENLYLVTFFSFIILLFSISGTRNTLAAMFFASGLYSETDRITKKSAILYILSICTHIGLLPIVFIRLLCGYLPKKRLYFVHIILACWMVVVAAFIGFFSNIQNGYIKIITRKVEFYIYKMYTQEFDARYITAMLILCILFAFIYFVESNNKSTYTNFMGYLIALTLGCIVSPVLFERYVRVLCACMLPMFIDLRKEKWMIKKLVMYSIAVLDVGMLCYQAWMFVSHFDVWFG